MRRRTIRVLDAEWNAAQEVASARGESLSEVIRGSLSEYAASPRPLGPFAAMFGVAMAVTDLTPDQCEALWERLKARRYQGDVRSLVVEVRTMIDEHRADYSPTGSSNREEEGR